MLRVSVAVAAAALFAAPAMAGDFFAELHGGYDGVVYAGHTYPGIDYGGGLGYEVTLHGKVYAAVQGNIDGSTSKSSFLHTKAGRDVSGIAKLGIGITEHISVYALGGYSDARIKGLPGRRKLDGPLAGVGWRYKLGNVYVKGEFDYTDYQKGMKRYQGIGGIGYIF